MIEHRCLRCGAVIGDAEPAVSSDYGPVLPASDDPLPPAESSTEAVTTNGGAAHVEDTGDNGDDPPTNAALAALRELGDLHASGVLTDQEFAAKKAELLRRV